MSWLIYISFIFTLVEVELVLSKLESELVVGERKEEYGRKPSFGLWFFSWWVGGY